MGRSRVAEHLPTCQFALLDDIICRADDYEEDARGCCRLQAGRPLVEDIVGRMGETYVSGLSARAWLIIPHRHRGEYVIVTMYLEYSLVSITLLVVMSGYVRV